MIVVCDTTPIRHLTAIGRVDLMPTLYDSLIVLAAVWRELQAESTPADVKRSLEPRHAWMIVRSPAGLGMDVSRFASLDAGECEAIQLAIELRADAGTSSPASEMKPHERAGGRGDSRRRLRSQRVFGADRAKTGSSSAAVRKTRSLKLKSVLSTATF
jgi:hypothetical protein